MLERVKNMASTKNSPIALVFGLSIIAILICVTVPVGLLYCYHHGHCRIVRKLTSSNKTDRPRHVEAPPYVEPRTAIPPEQIGHSKHAEASIDADEEDDRNPFVIGDDEEDQDPFEDVSEKEKPSVTASISKHYFEGSDKFNPNRYSAESHYDVSFDTESDIAPAPRYEEIEGESDEIDPEEDYSRPPSDNPWGCPWHIPPDLAGESVETAGRDSFDSVVLTSQRPIRFV